MVAKYNVYFSEPWQGVAMSGSFARFVDSEDEAVEKQVDYELIYQMKYKDPHARVDLECVE